jgi:hypothetical protein
VADLWFPTADGEDRRWHLAVEMAAEGLRTMRTACGQEAIALGDGVPFGKVPPTGQCYACMFKRGTQLADRREAEQPARIIALRDAILGGAVEVAEPERRQIDEGRQDG